MYDNRSVLFEHPNSEVMFKGIPITENVELNFGVGINPDAWDQTGDGVLFEIRIVDEKSQSVLQFSKYIDPKSNVKDRKWFDEKLSLSKFVGQEVSFVFRTTVGAKGNADYDWGGWSEPQIISAGSKKVGPEPAAEVIHPYLGYVYNPESNNKGKTKFHGNIPISEYGFLDKAGFIRTKSDEKVILGIFGGSVAFWFSVKGIESMLKELKKSSIFFNKEIIVVRVALGGYKQPQQLIALNYFLALGAHFDIIINIDGFNEVALPPAENVPKNVFPFFPRNWFMRVQDLPDPTTISFRAEIMNLRSKRSRYARLFSKAPFRYSVTLNTLWYYYDRSLFMQISENELALQGYKLDVSSYVATGPPYQNESEVKLFADLASVWKRSSLQMHNLCTANGIRYFHFLQPNQYVAGSKIMGEKERKQSFLNNHPYKRGVEAGYPYLIKMGEELIQEGVNFRDLTMIFAEKVEPLYEDDCCHFNKRGNEILGTVIGRRIVKELSNDHN